MPITFRHDAAGVVPPSNSATRKYGQQLVLQQQQQRQQSLMQQSQQKYQGYQAGLDRLFDATKQINQNQFMADRDQRQNEFLMGRDKAQFEQERQLQEAQRQQQFMDEARKMNSGMIMEDIKNGMYDPVTARRLQQSLADEAEVLGSNDYDATQRAEALRKIREKRLLDSTNRLEKPPQPTSQERFDQSIVTGQDGTQYLPNAKGGYDPLKQKEQEEPKRFNSAEEAFRADPKLRDKYMDDAKEIVTKGKTEPLTEKSRKEAADMARKLYEEENGLGTPTAAPALPGSPTAAAGQSKSILEGATGDTAPAVPTDKAFHDAMIGKGYKLMTPTDGASPYYYRDATPAAQDTSAFHADMTEKGYKLMTPTEGGGSPYYYRDAAPQQPAPRGAAPPTPASSATLTAQLPDPGMPPAPPSPWEQMDLETKRKTMKDLLGRLGMSGSALQDVDDAPERDLNRWMEGNSDTAYYSRRDGKATSIDNEILKLTEPGQGSAPVQPQAASTPSAAPAAATPPVTPAPQGYGTSSAAYYNAPDSGANPTAKLPDRGQPPAPAQASQNPWSEVAGGKAQTPAPAATPALQTPDFGALASSAKSNADREFITKIQKVHQEQSPDVQTAIGVLLSPSASDREAAEALMYLKSKGIDVEKLMQSQSGTESGMKGMENFSSSISTL